MVKRQWEGFSADGRRLAGFEFQLDGVSVLIENRLLAMIPEKRLPELVRRFAGAAKNALTEKARG